MVKAPPTSDARERCAWVTTAGLYERYHDEEWGVPTHDSDALFELIVLEGMQAGLSWLTILTKRRRFRERLFGFSAERLARANARDVESWMADPGLIRHRGKLEGVPVSALLGGARRKRVEAYASLLQYGGAIEHVRRNVARALERGYRHIKLHERSADSVA